MDQLISGIVDLTVVPLGNGIGWMASSGILALVFAGLWIALGAGILMSQGSLESAWSWIRSLPILIQLGAWLLFLPVMAGMWVWEQAWPVAVRVLLLAGLAGWNILVLLPKSAGRP